MLRAGFPEPILSQGDVSEMHINSVTEHVERRRQKNIRHIFRSPGEKSMVVLTPNTLEVRSADNTSPHELCDIFLSVLQVCIDNIPDFSAVLVKTVGVRTVDLFVPKAGQSLGMLVDAAILPGTPPDTANFRTVHALSARRMSDSKGGELAYVFEVLPFVRGQVQKVLPEDLVDPDRSCLLAIRGRDHWRGSEVEDYGMLDTQYLRGFPSQSLDKDAIASVLAELRTQAGSLFWGVVTDFAKGDLGYRGA